MEPNEQVIEALTAQVNSLRTENETLKDIVRLKDRVIKLNQHYYEQVTAEVKELKLKGGLL